MLNILRSLCGKKQRLENHNDFLWKTYSERQCIVWRSFHMNKCKWKCYLTIWMPCSNCQICRSFTFITSYRNSCLNQFELKLFTNIITKPIKWKILIVNLRHCTRTYVIWKKNFPIDFDKIIITALRSNYFW